MSWSTINEILGLALVDKAFREKLLSYPLRAVQEREFELTSRELSVIQHIHAHNLTDFSRHIIDNLYPRKRGKDRWEEF
jgi:hypothetical protein